MLTAVALPLSCTEREVSCGGYSALVALASLAPPLPLRLYRPRLATLRRVDRRTGPQRRGAHTHPVPARPRPTRRLEGPGDLRRNGSLEPTAADALLRPAARHGPREPLAWLPRLGCGRYQGPSQQCRRLGHLHLPRVHRSLPQPGLDRASP